MEFITDPDAEVAYSAASVLVEFPDGIEILKKKLASGGFTKLATDNIGVAIRFKESDNKDKLHPK